MNAYQSRIVHVALRETLLLLIAAAGSSIFYIHEFFTGNPLVPRGFTWDLFVLLTLILYVFIRAITIVTSMRAPSLFADLELCPECGQPLDDGTPKGLEAHRRITLTPRPTEKEIVAAVALRKAIDDARRAARAAHREMDGPLEIPGDVENAPSGFDRLGLAPSLAVTPKLVGERRSPKGPA